MKTGLWKSKLFINIELLARLIFERYGIIQIGIASNNILQNI